MSGEAAAAEHNVVVASSVSSHFHVLTRKLAHSAAPPLNFKAFRFEIGKENGRSGQEAFPALRNRGSEMERVSFDAVKAANEA